MLRRVKNAARLLLGRAAAGRSVTVFPDDVFIVSYPRSGNTWARFLIGNLRRDDVPVTFANIERLVPDIHVNTDEKLQRLRRPRILKSHYCFDPRFKKVIYIVRDPRDVAVSYYHYHIKVRLFEEGYPIDEYVSRLVSGTLDNFGSWGENVGSWLGARASSSEFNELLLVRYEDILEDPKHELRKIASFMRMGVSEEQLDQTIERSSAENMRELEKGQSDLWETTRKSRKDKPFVRSAKVGGWKAELPDSSARKIEGIWGELMEQLGYRL